MPNIETSQRRQVFLSYAQADRGFADRVADALRLAGNKVWFDAWALAPGDSITDRIQKALTTSDFLVVLLSPRSVNSDWVQTELNAALARELKDRAIILIPAMLEDCEIPPLLADIQYVDLRQDFEAGLQRLASQLAAASDIEFSRLDSRTFEQLVVDLLGQLGFSIKQTPPAHDSEFDFTASYRSRDPFGAEKTESWLVEAKFYKEQRVSVSALRQMVGYLMTSRTTDKGLVVTNGLLTSVAREFLLEVTHGSGHELRVIDGTALTNLIIQHPTISKRYFHRGEEK